MEPPTLSRGSPAPLGQQGAPARRPHPRLWNFRIGSLHADLQHLRRPGIAVWVRRHPALCCICSEYSSPLHLEFGSNIKYLFTFIYFILLLLKSWGRKKPKNSKFLKNRQNVKDKTSKLGVLTALWFRS